MLPPISTLTKKFKLRNDQVLSIRTNKIAGTKRPSGDRFIYIDGRYYRYEDVWHIMRQHAIDAKPLSYPVSLSKRYKTSEGDPARIYALDGVGLHCVHGAYLWNGEWHSAEWNLHGKHRMHDILNLIEV